MCNYKQHTLEETSYATLQKTKELLLKKQPLQPSNTASDKKHTQRLNSIQVSKI